MVLNNLVKEKSTRYKKVIFVILMLLPHIVLSYRLGWIPILSSFIGFVAVLAIGSYLIFETYGVVVAIIADFMFFLINVFIVHIVRKNKYVMILIINFLITFYGFIGFDIIAPKGTPNRSRDAGIMATINKASLYVQGYISAYREPPNDSVFLDTVSNIDNSMDCEDGDDYVCLFNIIGNNLNSSCNEFKWYGKGKYECYYRYEGSEDGANFRIWGKSWDKDILYVFDSRAGEILHCDVGNPHECKKVE